MGELPHKNHMDPINNLRESNLNLHLEMTCIQLSKYPVDIDEVAFKLMNFPLQKFIVSNHPEPGISGLEKRAPSGELEFFARSN